jgi:hypothetical protein
MLKLIRYKGRSESPSALRLRTMLTTLWNFWMRFSENVSSLGTYAPPPLSPYLAPPDLYLWGQQNLQCIVIANTRLTN